MEEHVIVGLKLLAFKLHNKNVTLEEAGKESKILGSKILLKNKLLSYRSD